MCHVFGFESKLVLGDCDELDINTQKNKQHWFNYLTILDSGKVTTGPSQRCFCRIGKTNQHYHELPLIKQVKVVEEIYRKLRKKRQTIMNLNCQSKVGFPYDMCIVRPL